MKKLSALVAVFGFIISTSSFAGTFLLEDYNLVTIENVSAKSLHVYGETLIGGDLTSTGLTFGERLNDTDTSLMVAGTVASSNGGSLSTKGNVIVNQSEENNVVAINASQTTVNGTYINNSKNVIEEDFSGTSSAIENNLISASNTFKSMTTNSFVNYENSTYQFTTNGLSSQDYAVFSLNATDTLFNNTQTQQIEIFTNDIAGVIINVGGENIDVNANFIGGTNNNAGNIIWNFYDALNLSFSSAFYGSILAPFATLTGSNDVDGSVGVKSISSDHSGQIHNQINTITPPSEVPEPPMWLLMSVLAVVTARFFKTKHSNK